MIVAGHDMAFVIGGVTLIALVIIAIWIIRSRPRY